MIRTGMLITVGVAVSVFLASALQRKGVGQLAEFFYKHEDRWWGGVSGWLLIWFLLIGTVITFAIAAVGAWKGLLQ